MGFNYETNKKVRYRGSIFNYWKLNLLYCDIYATLDQIIPTL